MTYEEFKEAVRDSVVKEFGDSAEVYLKTITKINVLSEFRGRLLCGSGRDRGNECDSFCYG